MLLGGGTFALVLCSEAGHTARELEAGVISLGLLHALQWQLGGWCALICTLQAIANMKTKDWDIKQVISAMT